MKINNWYRLDNSAMIYPMVITLGSQSLFRLGVVLKENIDANYLRIALNTALERFPYFKVELKSGLFRHYLEENSHYPPVEEDDGTLLKIINFKRNRHYLFRLSYFGNKIFLDLFHGLCDANGGIEFLKSITYYYFKTQNIHMEKDNIYTLSRPIDPLETEDAFDKYYKKFNFINGTKTMTSGFAYKISGKQFKYNGLGLIQGVVSTEKILELAHKYNCTLTVFISALAMLAVAKTNKNIKNKDNFVAFIPINLRKRYPSPTLGNFTIFAKCIIPYNTDLSLEKFVDIIKTDLEQQLSTEELDLKLSYTSLMDKTPLLRFMPLLLKSFISRIGRNFPSKSKQTMIISNLGKIDIDKDGDNIDYFMFNLNANTKSPDNMGIITYKDKTLISFSRRVVATEVEKEFFTILTDFGLNVCVNSNFREECDVL